MAVRHHAVPAAFDEFLLYINEDCDTLVRFRFSEISLCISVVSLCINEVPLFINEVSLFINDVSLYINEVPVMSKMKLYTKKQLPPVENVSGYDVRPGLYEVNGTFVLPAHYDADGRIVYPDAVNFTVHSHGATSCELLLFHRQETEPYAVIPFPEKYRIGDVYSMFVFGLDIEDFEYAFRLDGPYEPERGLIFDKNNILLDIYAKAVTGQSVWGEKIGMGHFFKARVVRDNFDWGTEAHPHIPMEDMVIYELHVRGFTKHESSGVTGAGTFRGIIEKIPYLKALGVNAVELMPIFEFDETRDNREHDGKRLLDYWGYNPISFFAPNTSYAYETEYNREGDELKQMIRELNRNDIECFLDVVFNHTSEGGANGPVISFKGFDNQIYYLLTPDGGYQNYSGCGNTMNCNHPIVRDMIKECLRYWTAEYHVDGFRFDLASILGRDVDGNPVHNAPLLHSLAMDPLLADVKLIAEAWDAAGIYQVGNFPSWKRWSEWNGKYRDDLRDYLKGGWEQWQTAAARITGSRDLYDPDIRGKNASINFLNCHDGFTLWDMYSYNHKHNEANGWDNKDGSDDNRSWNCGAEGETDDPAILALRKKLCRNAFTVLMLSRGTPMFFAGDEFLNSQQGNNNPYCQDNEISWLNWDDAKKNEDFLDFVKYLIHFRMSHSPIRKYSGESKAGYPEISSWLDHSNEKVLYVAFAGMDCDTGKDDIVLLCINVYWDALPIRLPNLPPELRWEMAADTSLRYLEKGYPSSSDHIRGDSFTIPDRSVLVFTAYDD